MAEKSFLDRAAEYAFNELDRIGGDPTKLDVPLQTIATLYTVQAIIDNGGFRYLFESDFPVNHPYSAFIEAYRRIGSTDAAERLEKAVAAFFSPIHTCIKKNGSTTWRPLTRIASSYNGATRSAAMKRSGAI